MCCYLPAPLCCCALKSIFFQTLCLRDGHEACVLTIGPVADEAASAIDSLAVRGHSIAHYDMVFAKPLDETIMREVAEKGLPVITVEDGDRKSVV